MARTTRDDIEKLYDYGVHPGTRTLFMTSLTYEDDGNESGTDFLLAEHILKGLHILDSQSNQPITIIMNNPGGDTYHGQAIYDAIKSCQSHITIKVFGHAMSMGAVILQAADKRILAPSAKLMLHYGSTSFHGHTKDAYSWTEECQKLDHWMEDIFLAKMPTFTRTKLQNMIRFDKFLTAEQAVELGLADAIL